MSPEAWIWLLPLLLIAAFVLFRRQGAVTKAEAHAMVEAGALLVDVRTPAEFAAGHLPGAVNVPLNEVQRRLDALGPKDQPKVLYCASGTRSAMARSMLKGRGYSQVWNLGAMSRW
jgi:phage shock protein E